MHKSFFSLDEELDEFGTEEEFADPSEEFDEEDEEEFENDPFGDSILDLAEQSKLSVCNAVARRFEELGLLHPTDPMGHEWVAELGAEYEAALSAVSSEGTPDEGSSETGDSGQPLAGQHYGQEASADGGKTSLDGSDAGSEGSGDGAGFGSDGTNGSDSAGSSAGSGLASSGEGSGTGAAPATGAGSSGTGGSGSGASGSSGGSGFGGSDFGGLGSGFGGGFGGGS